MPELASIKNLKIQTFIQLTKNLVRCF